MDILFVSPTNFNLYKPIEDELKRQGHNVYFIADRFLPHDNAFIGKNSIKKWVDKVFFNRNRVEKKYWDKIIVSYPNIENPYDLFLCINGYSVGNYLLSKLKKNNREIKSILYLWDTVNFYDFTHLFPLFDKTYTYDFNDSKKHAKLTFLPFYWLPYDYSGQTKYNVSLIGSHHDGRLHIAEQVEKQLKQHNLSYFIKIVCGGNDKMNLPLLRTLITSILKRDHNSIRDIKVLLGKEKHPLVTSVVYGITDMLKVIAMSDCILDTDMAVQSGPTPRLIWALAQGKKVITTNSHITEMPFFDSNRIQIIDRTLPIINIEFIKKRESTFYKEDGGIFKEIRIDNWIKHLLK